MTLRGIETLVYGVDDLDTCARFYDDFGLERAESDGQGVRFLDGSGSERSFAAGYEHVLA